MSEKSITKEDVLPMEVIHRIQSLLPPKEAANTCIVSKSWLHAWYTIPTLRIIVPNLDRFSTKDNTTKYNELIYTTLQRYHRNNMPIESFQLRIYITGFYSRLENVKNWIRLAVSRSCLKKLSLDIGVSCFDRLTLPNEIFSSQNLHIISVTTLYCEPGSLRFPICTNPPVINCVSLRILDLSCVVITPDMLHNLLSTCTLLEKIILRRCEGLTKVKVKNLLRLSEIEIESMKKNDLWDIDNVPRLCSFRYYAPWCAWRKAIPFQIHSLASVKQLCIEDVIIDNSFFNTIESKFSVLESLALGINFWKDENMVITSVSLRWLSLNLLQSRPVINVQVNAPRLLSFFYNGHIPGLLFRTTAPEQVELFLKSREDLGHSFFLRMREALNSSSKFYINMKSASLDSVVRLNTIDVDDLRRRDLFPVGNVELVLETYLDEHAWEQSQFFDAFFLICHPSYIRSSYQVIKKMMEGKTTDLKEVLLKNPRNDKWEALTNSCLSALRTFPGRLECKLNWLPQ